VVVQVCLQDPQVPLRHHLRIVVHARPRSASSNLARALLPGCVSSPRACQAVMNNNIEVAALVSRAVFVLLDRYGKTVAETVKVAAFKSPPLA